MHFPNKTKEQEMKKLIFLGFLILIFSFLFNCAGVPEEASSSEGSFSLILNPNFQAAEYQRINDQNAGLVGTWQADDNSRNLYSQIQFDENSNFLERVYGKLTHELMGSYAGKYNITADALEIVLDKGDMHIFSFNIIANRLQLSTK
jgi:hypothetical protein